MDTRQHEARDGERRVPAPERDSEAREPGPAARARTRHVPGPAAGARAREPGPPAGTRARHVRRPDAEGQTAQVLRRVLRLEETEGDWWVFPQNRNMRIYAFEN